MKNTRLSQTDKPVGLGDKDARLCLYTPHRPALPTYEKLSRLRPAQAGEVDAIIAETGNHWRKIFSIFAKIYTALYCPRERWQDIRDQRLFTAGSGSALLFQSTLLNADRIHIIGGKDFASEFNLSHSTFSPLDADHRIQVKGRCYLTPYLDYRQFPNALIDELVTHIQLTD